MSHCLAALQRCRLAAARITATMWQATAGLVALLLAGTAGGMLIYGNAVYTDPTYDLLKQVPGGMRAYGVALAALFVMVVYGFGQQSLGKSHVLRVALALTAAWYVGWLLAVAGTYVVQDTTHSWSAITANLFIAAVSNLVARNVPADRG